MSRYDWKIERLVDMVAPGSLRLSYSTDGADVCSFSVAPAGYTGAVFEPGDRLILREGERVVFSGYMPNAAVRSANAGAGEDAEYEFVSDWAILERTAYLRMNAKGDIIYPGVRKNAAFVGAGDFARTAWSWAANWDGSLIQCGFESAVNAPVPVPEGNGMTSCAGLMGEAARWVPGSFFLQRYDEKGGVLKLTNAETEGELVLGEDALLQSVSLQKKVEDVPPVCALVGGAHFVLPEGGDVREPGSFIFAVPMAEAEGGAVAGSKAASSKMVIKGVPVPERYVFERGESEHLYAGITPNGPTWQWIERFYPEFAPFLEKMDAAYALVAVVPKDVIAREAEGEDDDEEANKAPANYSEPPWSAGAGGGMYVLTEGSFAASSRKDKCLRGLSWCKAVITLNVRVSGLGEDKWKPLLAVAEEIFPGRRYSSKSNVLTHLTAKLQMECVLINRKRRIYDPATNAPCKGDAEYNAVDDGTEPLEGEYRQALRAFYDATRGVPYEGSVTLLRGDVHPADMLGKRLKITGRLSEWQDMPRAVVRAVQWDVGTDTVQLSVGAGGTLSFDEQLQRLMLARRGRVDEAQRGTVPYDVEDEELRAEEESAMSVSPSVNSSVGAAVAGKIVKPWTFYTMIEGEGDSKVSVVWLAGGTLRRGNKVWHVEDMRTQVEDGVPTDKPWRLYGSAPKITWKWLGGTGADWYYSITQD